MKIKAIIPARGGSKGIPQKNIADIHGKPLLGYTLDAVLQVGSICEVVISSDDDTIINVAHKYLEKCPNANQKQVQLCKRPEHLATDTAVLMDTILHTFQDDDDDVIIVLLQPTSPLRTADHITNALTQFQDEIKNGAKSLVSVVDATSYAGNLIFDTPQASFVIPRDKTLQRQQYKKVLELNGALYIARLGTLRQSHSFLTDHTVYFKMDSRDSLDIDLPSDLEHAKMVLHERT